MIRDIYTPARLGDMQDDGIPISQVLSPSLADFLSPWALKNHSQNEKRLSGALADRGYYQPNQGSSTSEQYWPGAL